MDRRVFDVYFDFCPSETIREDSPYGESPFVCSCVLLMPLTVEEEECVEKFQKPKRNNKILNRLIGILDLLKSEKIWFRSHCTASTEKEFYDLSKQVPPELPNLEDIAKELSISTHKAVSTLSVLKLVHLSIYSLIPGLKRSFPDHEEIPFAFKILIDRPSGRGFQRNAKIYRVINRKYHKLLAGYRPDLDLYFHYDMPFGKDDYPGHICADLLAAAVAGTTLMSIPGTPPDIAEAMTIMSHQLPKFSQEKKNKIIDILNEMASMGNLKVYDNIPALKADVDKYT